MRLEIEIACPIIWLLLYLHERLASGNETQGPRVVVLLSFDKLVSCSVFAEPNLNIVKQSCASTFTSVSGGLRRA